MFRSLLIAVLMTLTCSLQAQVLVELKISRHFFMAYEPVLATVSITNQAGRDILLQDADSQKWFSFNIFNGEDSPVGPRDLNYKVSPLTIPAGQTLKRKINLNELYPVNEFGLYRIRASVYFADLHKYFSSAPTSIEVSEGKLVWQQVVGVPEGQSGAGSTRVISLFSFRLPEQNQLYARVEDRDAGIIYCTHSVGRILELEAPQAVLDVQNQLHLLQLTAPKTYVYTRIGLNGELLEQTAYNQLKAAPHLKKMANGNVAVIGGQIEQPKNESIPVQKVPKLSDRPAGLPEN